MLIRRATRDDEDRLATIYLATWTDDVSPSGRPADGFRFFGETTEPEDVLVAVTSGVVCGYVWVRPRVRARRTTTCPCWTGWPSTPRGRAGDSGAALVDAAVDDARRRGGSKLTLRVLALNTAARRLYESAGLRVEG